MADEPEITGTEDSTEGAVAEAAEEKKADKLHQNVLITDVGPCRKHIKVTVERADIDDLLNEKYKELMVDQPAQIPGFRPGKAPREVVIRKFQKDVTSQVKGQVLMASLEQLAEDHDVAPLSAPDINYDKLDIPKEGPVVYEFTVEVRPTFDLPNYKGLKLKRPVTTFTDADVETEEKRILARYGELINKPGGNAQVGEFVVGDMTTKWNGQVIGSSKDVTLKMEESLAFKDGVAERFAEQ